MNKNTGLNFFDRMMVAFTFAEAGEYDKARGVMENMEINKQLENRNDVRQELTL